MEPVAAAEQRRWTVHGSGGVPEYYHPSAAGGDVPQVCYASPLPSPLNPDSHWPSVLARTSLGKAVRGEQALDDSAWTVSDTPPGFALREQVVACTSVREHDCILGAPPKEGEASSSQSNPQEVKRRSVTVSQLISALRVEFEKYGSKWKEKDVQARIEEIDPGAVGNAGWCIPTTQPTLTVTLTPTLTLTLTLTQLPNPTPKA